MKGALEVQHKGLEFVRRQRLEQQPYLLIIKDCEGHYAKELQNMPAYKSDSV